ncbi:Histidinol dehydrogenase [Dissulfuribacter thermophilus]|uniref:Histidinol dehydrogenase n=1 Tax=Dissulfuribacter thermophilus TaxID=1156395 RepID=A0A1B9F7M4_9BACT|nr:histidinol dehydrogenase [Dissulfuribacter thermophilus]OCC15890.1 Histidinol dehydrogenase [Dissulfuribacter thermophilus]
MREIKLTQGRDIELIKDLVRRFQVTDRSLEKKVEEILEDVKKRGDEALLAYTREFDCPSFTLEQLKVEEEAIEAAITNCEAEFVETLKLAAKNIRAFHEKQLPKSWFITREDGTIMGQMVRAVGSAGLYCPGGKGGTTPLVSTVLMNAIPAKIAGVERLAMVTPPDEKGGISPYLMVAAKIAGVDEIYKVGSAWAIAALAYGSDSIDPVDVIVGPGNIFVTLAKKLVSGLVGIDMIAGPSEVLIIADSSANPELIAADLLSQAEHDPMAMCCLVTTDESLLASVKSCLEEQLRDLPRKEICRESLKSNGVLILVHDLIEAAWVSNEIAPEHLELYVEEPWELLTQIKNAGAIFLGANTPESVGDYIAGPNHVLPTMGTARFSSALSVDTFLKRSSVISYSRSALLKDGPHVARLARAEGLEAHARSVLKRIE